MMKPSTKLTILKNRISNPCGEIMLDSFDKWRQVNKNLPLNKRVWKNIDGVRIPLGKMNRGHIQAAMQWCMARRGQKNALSGPMDKDGYTYDEWITMFLAKLLSPDTLE